MRTATQVAKEIEERTKPKGKMKGLEEEPKSPHKVSLRKVLSNLETGKTADRVFITEVLSDGRATVQDVGVKNVLVDPKKYQSRARPLDPEHVKDLAERRDINGGQPLYPVVLFLITGEELLPSDKILVMADGFHRWEENRIRGCATIRAFVIEVPDWEHQARLFAAMCNQDTLLKRTSEDKRKAIQILCDDPECATWKDQEIAAHIGVDARTVFRVRREWVIEHKKNLPRPVPRKERPAVVISKGNGPAPATARTNVLIPGAEAMPAAAEIRPPLHNTRLFKDWLLKEAVVASSPAAGATSGLYINGLLAGGFAFVLCDGTDINDAYIAMAKALVLRKLVAPGSRAAVVLRKQAAHRKLYELGDGLGVDFLSPEELVSAIDGAGNGKAKAR